MFAASRNGSAEHAVEFPVYRTTGISSRRAAVAPAKLAIRDISVTMDIPAEYFGSKGLQSGNHITQ